MSFFLFPKIILEVFLSFFIYHTEFTLHLDLREDMSMSILKANTQKCSCPPPEKNVLGPKYILQKETLGKMMMMNAKLKLEIGHQIYSFPTRLSGLSLFGLHTVFVK